MRRSQIYKVAFLAVVALVPCIFAAWEIARSRAAAPADSAVDDTDKGRQALAERCVKAAPTEVVARLACRRVATVRSDIPESRREEFAKAMMSELDLDMMKAKRIEVMAKHLTADELKALAEFYESPSGHSAWQKLDEYVVAMHAEMKTKMSEAESRARKALSLPDKE